MKVFSERFKEEKHDLNMDGTLLVDVGLEQIEVETLMGASVSVCLLPDASRCDRRPPTVQLQAIPTALLSLI